MQIVVNKLISRMIINNNDGKKTIFRFFGGDVKIMLAGFINKKIHDHCFF